MKKEDITIKKCIGCGSVLQTINENEVGYIPLEKYNDSSYCQRCFKLIHYNKKVVSKLDYSNQDIINKLDTYVFFLTDLFNISKEVIETYKSINTPKMLLISKSDLIPKDIKLDNIKRNIMDIYNIDDNIVFISSKKNSFNIENKLKELNINKCYIVGFTNAGKSTFINKIRKENTITESNTPNTTLYFISIKYNNIELIDTPGFNLKKTFYQEDDFDLIKRLNPKYYIKPKVYQAKPEQVFNIEDKLFINISNYSSMIFYMSNLVKIKKIYKHESNYDEIKINANSDIIIPSLGFINIKKECIVKINKEMIDLIEIRKSLFA